EETKNICQYNEDCPPNKYCDRLNRQCINPCVEFDCGENTKCVSSNHQAQCTCLPGYQGNPHIGCQEISISDPCVPNPCGLNALCENDNGNPVCFCPKGLTGSPFEQCIPEGDQCDGDPCGANSGCRIVNGQVKCFCLPGYEGNPPRTPCALPSISCDPSPCGPNTRCSVLENGFAKCTCLPGYIESPNTIRGCVPQVDQCEINPCGLGARCNNTRVPPCYCPDLMIGNPYKSCGARPAEPYDPCLLSPCGKNAICTAVDGIAKCTCIPPFVGNPYIDGCEAECIVNRDCESHLACFNQHCRDPCPGVCGANAHCEVINHLPMCSCLPGYTGDPFRACKVEKPLVPDQNPCMPSPCGPHSICRVMNDRAVCSCSPGYQGTPPHCRPECLVSTECPAHLACINQKCNDPCPGLCGLNADCQVINHNPICSCPRQYIGDPFTHCAKEEPLPPTIVNPCLPSPCGSNADCRVQENHPICTCISGMFGAPPNCRPECMIDQDCISSLACIQKKCLDPCVGSCGFNTNCTVQNHRPICQCYEGYEGDPFSGCAKAVFPAQLPCDPSPCGANAVCKERNGAGSCTCLPDYTGDPYVGCRPECVQNSDCVHTKACINNKCKDPCVGACGINAQCQVYNHQPSCSCLYGYTGDPLTSCHIPIKPPVQGDTCQPSPCGPYSNCRVIDNHAVCSCQPNYIGSPPSCRPECVVSTDCSPNAACINQRCKDPCVGTCGVNADCRVINHNPVCICAIGYSGDPFFGCVKEVEVTPAPRPSGNPCVPSPCGPNSQCRVIDGFPACSCLPNYVGRAPNCRPECVINEGCPGNLACQKEQCVDPCPGSCGVNTYCNVVKHNPVCICNDGYTGNPFTECTPIVEAPITTEQPRTPCNPSPCGANAVCNERNGVGSCTCLPQYFGDPYIACRPECVTNADCDRSKACLNNKCINPCPDTCGQDATCRVVNHAPMCSCLPGYTGDPVNGCTIVDIATPLPSPIDPCDPSPCGPNSNCRIQNEHAVCLCQPGFSGIPPTCRPGCIVSSECSQNKACIHNNCADPCPGSCGQNTNCLTVNHNPICSCASGYSGDPFVHCARISTTSPLPKGEEDPCFPNPCGPNSQCKVIGLYPACSCLQNYIGRPPNCRPECTDNSECFNTAACINQRCKNPCLGACGELARCTVQNHVAFCTCPEGYEGEPTVRCVLALPPAIDRPVSNPCSPNPCGPNAQCRERNGAGACGCPPDLIGDPYDIVKGCHRECETNNDCAPQLACVGFKCTDPCPNTCGTLSICNVQAHVPVCLCPPGYTGDPYFACEIKEMTKTLEPCSPSPCGPNSKCRVVNGQAVCSCLPDYRGIPPSCRPECIVNAECPPHLACVNTKCADPCPNTCGLRAQCITKNHNPICTCPAGFTGDPFTLCSPHVPDDIPITERPPSCTPSPCGPNSLCQIISGNPACSCLPNYIGVPPQCRPECILSSECKSHLACVNQRCSDPCPGSCGINAQCHVLNHLPVCTCMEGFTGDPFTQCSIIPP
ncbi:neurogenic locus notch homolog protein 3-like, partial [Formica exsecta]|uniref:neurogenic locus notch homolog protein 3-like n=1 Tax=Formica exsecta TaxID=72781 RepID=UPI0011424DD9